MTFLDISEALVSTAKDEGLTVSYCNGNPAVQNGLNSMGLIVSNDDLSFYFRHKHFPGLLIQQETNPDAALSRGLDFIYS